MKRTLVALIALGLLALLFNGGNGPDPIPTFASGGNGHDPIPTFGANGPDPVPMFAPGGNGPDPIPTFGGGIDPDLFPVF